MNVYINVHMNVHVNYMNGQMNETVKHLGNTLEFNISMKSNCLQRRGKFIGKIHSLLQEFHYAGGGGPNQV